MTECVHGRPVRQPVECECCGEGPLHGLTPLGMAKCSCSFRRGRLTVCRDCAVAIDLTQKGWTQIEWGPDRQTVTEIIDLYSRGLVLAAGGE